ncbi:MAG: FHA domain-containing protein [Candidatus Brocadiae bacterium]|nr:FHA domain-containing protein [Candidatus Brocadiia bacterium]
MERLIVIENGEEKIVNISSRVISIGRSSKNDISLKDRNASRRHCNILKVGDTWFAVDCDSQNGTFINGEKIKKKELEDGDKITIGAVDILFVLTEIVQSDSLKDSPSKPEKADSMEEELPPIKDSVLQKDSLLMKEQKEGSSAPEKAAIQEEDFIPFIQDREENEIISNNAKKKEEKEEKDAEQELFLDMEDTIPPQSIPLKKIHSQAILKRIEKCYELFKHCLMPEITHEETIPEFLFMALISGGHCILEGSSRLHQYILLNRTSFSLGLSTRTIYLTPAQKLWQMSGNNNLVVLENFHGNPPELESFFLKNTPDLAMPGSPLSAMQNSTMVVFCLPQQENDVFSELNSYFMFKLLLPVPDSAQQMLLLEPIKIEEKKENIVTANEEILAFQKAVFQMPVSLELKQYIGKILDFVNPGCSSCPEEIAKYMKKRVDVYSGVLLLKAAKAWAAMNAKEEVSKEDIHKVLPHILIPRLWLSIDRSASEATTPALLYNKITEKVLE